jgi:tRNA pseudouridine55 synthase
MDGILLIDKPAGWTSFDVVNKVRSIIRHETGQKKPKVGHTGTLDPLATGLLVLLLGSYTKRAPELAKLDKTYEVSMHLGLTSTSGDEEGEKSVISDRVPSYEDIEDVVQAFLGEIQQIPPAYSAVKINGQRAYALARKGHEVKLEPRTVTIFSIDDLAYAYPEVTFTTRVSSGTYIRSLVEDIGNKLGTGAYMSSLRRSEVGAFNVLNAITTEQLTIELIQKRVQQLA